MCVKKPKSNEGLNSTQTQVTFSFPNHIMAQRNTCTYINDLTNTNKK